MKTRHPDVNNDHFLAYRTYVCTSSAADGNASDAIILLGSLGADHTLWNEQIAPLTEIAPVMVIDADGHGQSPILSSEPSMAHLAAAVVDVVKQAGYTRAHIVGISLGGAIAQQIAIDHAPLVASLVLISTAASFDASFAQRGQLAREQGTEELAAAVVQRWFTPEYAELNPTVVQHFYTGIVATSDEGYARCCQALAGWDVSQQLPQLDVPTLVISADQDPSTPPAMVFPVAAAIPAAQLASIADAAHLVPVSHSREVSALITAHISAELS